MVYYVPSLQEPRRVNGDKMLADLTAEQRARLNALIERLDTFPVPELIVSSIEMVGIDPRVETDRLRLDAAMAGAWAYDRALLYLERLRRLNAERMQLGEAIRQLRRHPYPKSDAEIEPAARAMVMAPHLTGMQEIVANFFCVSVQHIRSLLLIVAAAVGYEIPKDDLDFLDEFRFRRNHFEHWYDRLPGKDNEAGLVTKTLTADEYRVQGGLQIDEKDRFIVIEPRKSGAVSHNVDVTNDGVERVERIVRETSAKVKERAIQHVRTHFVATPQNIPSPDAVRFDLLVSAGG